ncbi:MAG: cytochrome c3 family protein, partial [Anaerolineae bacterium]
AGCIDCHADQQFAGTTQVCVDCHEKDVETIHTETFGLDCARCHTAAAWTPAQLNQHTYLLDHGDEGQLECQTCHTMNYYEHTCAECHDDEEMATFHEVENDTAVAHCVQCHPTGAADEATNLGYSLPVQDK